MFPDINKKFSRPNKSGLFLLPITLVDPKDLEGRLNIYYRCEYDRAGDDYIKYRLYVVFYKNEENTKQEKIDKLSNYTMFIKKLEVGDFIIFVYRIPHKFRKDYEKIIRGEYSRTSREYKKIVYSVLGRKFMSLNPLDPTKIDLRKVKEMLGTSEDITETRGMMNEEEETFKISNFVNIQLS